MAKFEKGRRCLVLRSTLIPEMEGKVIMLGDRRTNVLDGAGKEIKLVSWESDPPILTNRPPYPKEARWSWPEKALMPLDDPDINEQLKKEQDTPVRRAIEEMDTMLAKLDKMIEQLSQAEKRTRI